MYSLWLLLGALLLLVLVLDRLLYLGVERKKAGKIENVKYWFGEEIRR